MEVTLPEIVGYAAASLVLVTFFMKTMLPLRVVAMLSNVAFIAYGIGANVIPILMLHAVLLPLNLFRTWQYLRELERIRLAADNPADVTALLPFMIRQRFPKDHSIFQIGDHASEMYYIKTGEVYLPEIDRYLQEGELFGEIGMFSDRQRRITSAICNKPCTLYVINKKWMIELFNRDPAFAFYLTKLITNRMDENLVKMFKEKNA